MLGSPSLSRGAPRDAPPLLKPSERSFKKTAWKLAPCAPQHGMVHGSRQDVAEPDGGGGRADRQAEVGEVWPLELGGKEVLVLRVAKAAGGHIGGPQTGPGVGRAPARAFRC